jgi:DNA-binding response OmpR family regulator
MAILVVEDEADLSDLLIYILRRAGHEVITAFDGDSAIRLWRECQPELILLDIGLPRKTGWDVCRAVRSESSTPIMILSAADSEEDIVRGLDLGAEDYMTKPFSPRVLQARVRTLLHRAHSQPVVKQPAVSAISAVDLKLDPDWTVSCKGKSIRLTRLEHRILRELALHLGQVMPHEELIQRVWGYSGEASSNILKGHVRNIRMKLESLGSDTTIRIMPGVGYILSNGGA